MAFRTGHAPEAAVKVLALFDIPNCLLNIKEVQLTDEG